MVDQDFQVSGLLVEALFEVAHKRLKLVWRGIIQPINYVMYVTGDGNVYFLYDTGQTSTQEDEYYYHEKSCISTALQSSFQVIISLQNQNSNQVGILFSRQCKQTIDVYGFTLHPFNITTSDQQLDANHRKT